MGRKSLGELEEQVLLALIHLGGEGYTVPVVELLADRAGREVTPATAYMVLRRLEKRGLLSSRLGDPTAERGGRPKRYFRVASEAIPVLRRSRARMMALWEGIEGELGVER